MSKTLDRERRLDALKREAAARRCASGQPVAPEASVTLQRTASEARNEPSQTLSLAARLFRAIRFRLPALPHVTLPRLQVRVLMSRMAPLLAPALAGLLVLVAIKLVRLLPVPAVQWSSARIARGAGESTGRGDSPPTRMVLLHRGAHGQRPWPDGGVEGPTVEVQPVPAAAAVTASLPAVPVIDLMSDAPFETAILPLPAAQSSEPLIQPDVRMTAPTLEARLEEASMPHDPAWEEASKVACLMDAALVNAARLVASADAGTAPTRRLTHWRHVDS